MTNIDEQFCLKWNDFHNNVITSYSELQETNDFSDVTLVGEENHQIQAHMNPGHTSPDNLKFSSSRCLLYEHIAL